MPGLKPTPQRRRRLRDDVSDDSNDGDSSQISRQATPLSQASTSSKRMRLNSDVGIETQPTYRVLDDSSRIEGHDNNINESVAQPDQAHSEFQPGAIVRIKLTDFVTYTSAEFFPGPKLNMVIGPNGTGKSTLVCAICLGLGWGPQVRHIQTSRYPI
jgi:structural maintenance of chromosomes protein 5